MAPDAETSDGTIYDITNDCLDSFDYLVSSTAGHLSEELAFIAIDVTESGGPIHDVNGLRNDLSFWIDYTGALAHPGASLDDRLHGHDRIKGMVIELLQMVARNLIHCK